MPVFLLAALLATVATGGGSAAQLPVRASGLEEQDPAASAGYLAWSQSRPGSQRRFDVYARRAGARPFRVNRPGTQGRAGGLDGATLVYQEITRGRSDVRLFDLRTRRALPTPRGVNTTRWEWRPTLSGGKLLLGRIDAGRRRSSVVLHDLRTGRESELDATDQHAARIYPGQLAGRFSVWTKCLDGYCTVYRYDVRTRRTAPLPNPRAYVESQYGASVTAAGTAYFGRSGPDCGSSVRIVRAPLVGPARVVERLAAGQDFLSSYATGAGGGQTRVLFDRADCRSNAFDLYEILDGS